MGYKKNRKPYDFRNTMPGKKPEIARQLLKFLSMIPHFFRHTNGLMTGTREHTQCKKGEKQYKNGGSFHGVLLLGGDIFVKNVQNLELFSYFKPKNRQLISIPYTFYFILSFSPARPIHRANHASI